MLHNVAARLRAGGETPWFFRWNGLANRTAMRVLGTPVKPGEAAARTTNPEVGGSNPPGRASENALGKPVSRGRLLFPAARRLARYLCVMRLRVLARMRLSLSFWKNACR